MRTNLSWEKAPQSNLRIRKINMKCSILHKMETSQNFREKRGKYIVLSKTYAFQPVAALRADNASATVFNFVATPRVVSSSAVARS